MAGTIIFIHSFSSTLSLGTQYHNCCNVDRCYTAKMFSLIGRKMYIFHCLVNHVALSWTFCKCTMFCPLFLDFTSGRKMGQKSNLIMFISRMADLWYLLLYTILGRMLKVKHQSITRMEIAYLFNLHYYL